MDKNYYKAILISLLILILYPVALKFFYPQATKTQTVSMQVPAPQAAEKPLSPPAAAYLVEAAAPTTIVFENELYQAEFSTLGGTITRLFFKGEAGRQEMTQTEFFNIEPLREGTFGVNIVGEIADFEQTQFRLVRRGAKNEIFEFTYTLPGAYEIVKIFTVHEDKPTIDLTVRIRNISQAERSVSMELRFAMNYEKGFEKNYGYYDAVAYAEKIHATNLGSLKKKTHSFPENLRWAGMIKKYFAILIKPDGKIASVSARADDAQLDGTMIMEPVTLAAGGDEIRSFLIYAGPQRYETLKGFEADFESVFSRGFFGIFKTLLLSVLKFFYSFTNNFGWAIVLLTLVIKLLFAPLTHVSYANMKKMQAIAPKMKALQENYKNDPQKQQHELMLLYRRNKVNPVMGCLPMLLQIPVFIAMFRLLPEAIELHGAPFIFWITDLSAPDRLITFTQSLPFVGWNSINVLPILMAVSQVWYQKIMPQQPGSTPEQAAIMNWMPVFFGFICYNMPSGLTLYWTLQNLFSIIQQVFINRIAVVLHHEDR